MRNTKRHAMFVGLVLGTFACAVSAAAQKDPVRCGHAGRPWVALVFVGNEWTTPWRENVSADLRAGLRLRGIDVCALGADGSEPPLAMVQLSSPSRDHVSVSIDVHDAITEKRVLRDIDLRNVTADGRGLTVAQAAEELLRASWAELALDDAPEPALEPPIEVTRAVEPRSAREAMLVYAHEIGARFTLQHHGGGATLFGGDAFFTLWLAPRLGAELAVGVREGFQTEARHGVVDASALAGSLDMVLSMLPRSASHDLLLKVGSELLRMRLTGHADTGGTSGTQDDAFAWSARLGLAARASVTRSVRLGVELGAGLPLSAASATDSGKEVVGTSGFVVHATLGAGVVF